MTRRHRNVVNLSEIEPQFRGKGSRFGVQYRRLAMESGGVALGCSYFEVEPGKSMCPHHWHAANEEAIFILEGEGTARIGDESVSVKSGDYIAMPVGPEHAHQLINTGSAPLRYLCMSNRIMPEVVGYPDADKVAAITGPDNEPWVAKWFPADANVDYYDGEDTGE